MIYVEIVSVEWHFYLSRENVNDLDCDWKCYKRMSENGT